METLSHILFVVMDFFMNGTSFILSGNDPLSFITLLLILFFVYFGITPIVNLFAGKFFRSNGIGYHPGIWTTIVAFLNLLFIAGYGFYLLLLPGNHYLQHNELVQVLRVIPVASLIFCAGILASSCSFIRLKGLPGFYKIFYAVFIIISAGFYVVVFRLDFVC